MELFMNGLLVLVGYLVGSISFSYIIAKKIAGIDIRQHGSSNAGATNTLRVLGKGPALFVLLLDGVKGIVPVLIGMLLGAEPLVLIATGIAAIAGHNWPVFFGFKGGKGVATTIGVMAMFYFWPTLIASILAILTIAITRYVSLGSMVLMLTVPIILITFNYQWEYILGSIIMFIFAVWRHRANIIRLVRGEENKLRLKKV